MEHQIGKGGVDLTVPNISDINVKIESITDIGINPYCVSESGFRAWYTGCFFNIFQTELNPGWELLSTPDSEYVVPTTVAGKNVAEVVWIDSFSGTPIIDKPINLQYGFDNFSIESIKVTTSEIDFVWDSFYAITDYFDFQLDLSECGDDILIPDGVIERLNDENYNYTVIIYVNPTVKEKYKDYSFIVAK